MKRLALLLLCAGPLAAQVPPAPAAAPAIARGVELPIDRIVAIVGAHPVLFSEVLEAVNQRRAQGMELPSDSAAQMEIARKVLQELVDEEVLVQKAALEKIEVTDADLARTVDGQIKRIRDQFRTEVEYREELTKAGFGSPEEYRKRLTDQARRSSLQRRVIDKLRQDGKLVPASVAEADVSEAFERNKATLPKRPASVVFRQLVLAPAPAPAAREAARVKAESLLAEIKAGGDFELIAKRESADSASRESGGDLGWNRRGFMVPQFDMVMFALRPGDVSPVVETSYGFHIIRVDRVQPAEVKARHILVRWKVDSAAIEKTRLLADSLANAWRAGAAFDDLVSKFHDPAEDKGMLEPYPRDSLPESYQRAFAGKKNNEVTDPFRVEGRGGNPPKFIIAQIVTVSEGGEYTVSDLREQIRTQLSEERSIRRLLDALRRDTYVSIRL